MKFWAGFVGVFATCLVAQSATFTDIQNIQNPEKPDDGYVKSGGAFSSYFNIISPGSLTATIAGFGSADGTFTDAGGYVPGTELVDVTVSFYLTDSSFIPIDIICFNLDDLLAGALMWGHSAAFTFSGGSALLDVVEEDGMLQYYVKSVWGDFRVKHALLTATTSEASPAVPDGGATLLLLGGALAGLAGLQRRFNLFK